MYLFMHNELPELQFFIPNKTFSVFSGGGVFTLDTPRPNAVMMSVLLMEE